MIGSCEKCKRPLLERFNGVRFCPKCGQNVKINSLCINKENEEMFKLSEICFLRYLSPMKGALAVEDRKSLLSDAIRICQEAANDGHPKAVFRMGYYYQYFMQKDVGESERMRRAFDNYWKICDTKNQVEYYDLMDNKFTSETLTSADEYNLLKKQAAINIMDMLFKYPEVFNSSQVADNRYKLAKKEIISKYGSYMGVRGKYDSKRNVVKDIYNALASCYSKHHPALCGVFSITAAELRELLAIRVDAEKGYTHNADVMCEQLRFHYLVCDKNGKPDVNRQSDFYSIREAVFPTEVRMSDSDKLYFAFFNKGGKHSRLSKKQADRVIENILDSGHLVALVGGSSHNEIVLYDEDIVWMKKVLKGDIADFVEDIVQEG